MVRSESPEGKGFQNNIMGQEEMSEYVGNT